MTWRPEQFLAKPRLIKAAGRSGVHVFPENGECLPKGKGLEGEDYLHTRTLCHAAYQRKVAAQQSFLYYVARGVQIEN